MFVTCATPLRDRAVCINSMRGFMPGSISNFLNESGHDVRGRLIALYTVLLAANILVWIWAFVA